MKISAGARALLVQVAEATQAGGSLFVNPNAKETKALVKANLIETNPQIVGEGGQIAGRTTAAGSEEAGKPVPAAAPRATPVRLTPPEGGFEIIAAKDAPEAPVSKRAAAKSVYPFDKLSEVGSVFFVPATAEIAEPWNKLRGTVSSANKKFGSDKIAVESRAKFTVFEGERNGQKGAYVKRVPYTAPQA